jgi:hypothetical protein
VIANPKDAAVLMLDGGDVEDQTVSIRPLGDNLKGFALHLGESRVCWSLSSRALSKWALEEGARFVRFDFDLRLDP